LRIADCGVQGAGCRVQGAGGRVRGAGCWVRGADCGLRIADCGFVELLRSVNYNGPFDTTAHDRQNSLNLESKI